MNEELNEQAVTALTDFFSDVIRNEIGEIGDDPDHGGPEDAARELAESLILQGYERLLTGGDWRDLLP